MLSSLLRSASALSSRLPGFGPSLGLGSRAWLPAVRSIISVDVWQPPERSMQDPESRRAAQNEIARSEEVAMSQYNRLVSQEIQAGTLRNGVRRMKRFARMKYPTLVRRDKGELNAARSTHTHDAQHALREQRDFATHLHPLACTPHPNPNRPPAARAVKWREHKKKLETYTNWIMYRQRRAGA